MRVLGAALAAACFIPAGGAFAAISIGTDLGGGSFQNVGYGATGVASQVSPFLYVKELASTQAPPTQVSGTALTYNATFSGAGSSALEIVYTLQNTGGSAFTDLRFMVNAQADGSGSFNDTATEAWGAAIAGDPDKRQIQSILDFPNDTLATLIPVNNGVTEGPNPCVAACDVDLGLQWNRATLGAGETWTIRVKLVDDPALVIGGRYLTATSADTAGTALVFGNPTLVPEPQTYALVLAGLGLISWLRMRRRDAI
jgi:hypothetical protein